MLYSWQQTCAFGSAVAFALCVSDAAGRRRILPFTRGWVAHSSRTLRTGKKNPASARWRSWPQALKSHFRSSSPDYESLGHRLPAQARPLILECQRYAQSSARVLWARIQAHAGLYPCWPRFPQQSAPTIVPVHAKKQSWKRPQSPAVSPVVFLWPVHSADRRGPFLESMLSQTPPSRR
jgi:hypothetical protein